MYENQNLVSLVGLRTYQHPCISTNSISRKSLLDGGTLLWICPTVCTQCCIRQEVITYCGCVRNL
jgi:hypothetical protein